MDTGLYAEPREESVPSAREFFLQAWGNRRGAAAIFGSVLLACLVVAALIPAGYRASATLAVLPAPEFTVRQDAGSHDQQVAALALDQIMKAETEILGGDDLHLATIEALGAKHLYPDMADPGARGLLGRLIHGLASIWIASSPDRQAKLVERRLRRFAGDLQILPAKDSNIITVSFTSRDADMTAGAVNTMLSLYAARRRQLYADPQLAIVAQQATRLEAEAAQADQRLADFKRDHDIADFAAQRGLLLHRKSVADQALADAGTQVAEQLARIEILGRQLKAEPATIGVFSERDGDTRVQTAEQALQDLRSKMASAAQRYRDDSRVMTGLRAELATREVELQRLNASAGASVVRQGRNPTLDSVRLDRLHAAAELQAAQARVLVLRAEQAALAQALKDCESNEATLAALQRDQAMADDALHGSAQLVAERHLTEAEDALRLANVRIIQTARVPRAAQPTPFLILAAGVLLGGLLAGLWLAAIFIRRGVFLTEEGLARALELPVLASFTLDWEADQEAVLAL